MVLCVVLAAENGTVLNKKILVAGDSWGTVFATGAVFGEGFMSYILKKHGCPYTGATNIAQAGSTADLVDQNTRTRGCVHVLVIRLVCIGSVLQTPTSPY